MPKGQGYSEMGYFGKKERAARKKKKVDKKKKKLDTKRKESRRGKQRAALRESGVDEKKIDRMLPWGNP